jgi:hypothetical protein
MDRIDNDGDDNTDNDDNDDSDGVGDDIPDTVFNIDGETAAFDVTALVLVLRGLMDDRDNDNDGGRFSSLIIGDDDLFGVRFLQLLLLALLGNEVVTEEASIAVSDDDDDDALI